jgi:hypothetical protein
LDWKLGFEMQIQIANWDADAAQHSHWYLGIGHWLVNLCLCCWLDDDTVHLNIRCLCVFKLKNNFDIIQLRLLNLNA